MNQTIHWDRRIQVPRQIEESDFTRVLDRSQDTHLRDSGWQLKNDSIVENEVEYRYDPAERLNEVEAPSGLFTYGYQANSYVKFIGTDKL